MLDSLDAGQPVMTPKPCTAEHAGYPPDRTSPGGPAWRTSAITGDTLQVTRDSSDKNRLNFISPPDPVSSCV
ncbi:hypothetical protein OIU92_00150 [Escherichia coli]|nr:hypothetical protein [Escherichia coli]